MTRPQRTPGLVGVALVFLGCAAVLASYSVLSWYSAGADGADRAARVGFEELRHNVDALGATPVAAAYFNWLGWVLLVALPLVGTLANLPWAGADITRMVGFLVGLAGAAATFYAVAQLFHAQATAGGTTSVWHNSTYGFWAAPAGFGLAALGSALGPAVGGSRRPPEQL